MPSTAQPPSCSPGVPVPALPYQCPDSLCLASPWRCAPGHSEVTRQAIYTPGHRRSCQHQGAHRVDDSPTEALGPACNNRASSQQHHPHQPSPPGRKVSRRAHLISSGELWDSSCWLKMALACVNYVNSEGCLSLSRCRTPQQSGLLRLAAYL